MPTRCSGGRGIRERRGPGGTGERADPHLDPRRSAASPGRRADAAPQCAGRRPPARPGGAARPGPRLRGLRRGCRVRLGLGETRADHGRLRAERRRRCRRRVLLRLRPQPPDPVSARLDAVRPLLGHGLPGQSGLGLVRGRAGRRRAQSELRRPVLPVLRAARHRGTPGARQTAGDQGRLGLSRPGRLADRRLPAHPRVEPRPRPGRPGRGTGRRAHRAVTGVPAARHRPGQHGARAALPALGGEPVRGQHRDRRARADRDVRRPVHLPAAARRLPLRPAARRGLVRRLAAPGVRPVDRAARRPARAGGTHARGPRAPAGAARRAGPPAPAPAERRARPVSALPADRRFPRRAHAVPRRRRVHPGHPLQRPQRPQRRPCRADHRGHRGARARRAPGHHAARQHHPHPGTGAEGEPLPLPGTGIQRRHHDRRAQRHPPLRLPGRRRGVRPPRGGPGGDGTGRAHPPGGPGPRRARGAALPRRQPGRGTHHPDRVPLPLRRRRLAERRVDRQPAPRRPHLQQP